MSIRTQSSLWRPKTKDEVTRYTYLKCSSGKAHNKRREDRVWYINTSKKENWLEKYGKEATGPTCILPNHREELIENLIDLEIQKLFFEDAIIEHFEIILKQDAEKARQEITKELTALKAEKAKLETQKKGYINMKARELISDEEFLSLKRELDTKLEKLQIELSAIQQNINQFEENIEYTCYILETLKNKWFGLNKQEKAEIFKMMTCQRELGNEKTGKLLIKWEKPWDALSLIPKGVNGVGQGGAQRVVADGDQRNDQSQQGRQQKHSGSQLHLIRKILQPAMHHQIGQRPGDQSCQGYPFEKLFGNQTDDAGNGGSQNLANADLLGLLFGSK